MSGQSPAPRSTADVEPSSPCPVCREPIRVGVKKSIHCDSFLDWRQTVGVRQTTLALLVALISVVSSTVPRFVEWLSPDYSDLHVEVRQVYLDGLELFVSNSGNQPGRLIGATIAATTMDGRQLGPDALQVASDGNVGPNRSIVAHLTIHPESVAGFLAWPHRDISQCSLVARIANYRAKPQDVTLDCSGENFRRFCRGTEGAALERGRIPPPLIDALGRPAGRCG